VAEQTIDVMASALNMYTFLELAKQGPADKRIAVKPIDLMTRLEELKVVPKV
jgi:hypothetical protein